MKNKKILLFLLSIISMGSIILILQQNVNFSFTDTIRVARVIKEEEQKPVAIFPLDESGSKVNRFDFEAEAGESAQGKLQITNPNKYTTVAFELYVVNAMAPNGEFFVMSDDSPKEQAMWFDFDQPEVTLKPQENKIISFEGSIPKDAPSGNYIVAIIGKTKKAESVESAGGGVGFKIVTRVAIPVHLTVKGGLVASAEVGKATVVQKHPFTVGVPVTNTGEVTIKPYVKIMVIDEQGKMITVLQAKELFEIPPGESKNFEVPWLYAPQGAYEFDMQVAFYGRHYEQKFPVEVEAAPEKAIVKSSQPQGGILPMAEPIGEPKDIPLKPAAEVLAQPAAAQTSVLLYALIGIVAVMAVIIGILLRRRKKSDAAQQNQNPPPFNPPAVGGA